MPWRNPPGRVSAELEAEAMVELVHGPHQAAVALLDQVGERQTPATVLLRDRHHQPQVRRRQFLPRLLVHLASALNHMQQSFQLLRVGTELRRGDRVGLAFQLVHPVGQHLGARRQFLGHPYRPA